MKPVNLSIVIPAYREAPVIQTTLRSLSAWLKDHDYGEVEVIVVAADGGDRTAELAQDCAHLLPNFQVIEPGPRAGKGRDVRLGILTARGRYRLFMDADLATPLHYLDDAHRLMQQNVDLAIAVRNGWAIHTSWRRRFMSTLGNVLVQTSLLPGISDTQCGFKVFRADVAEAVFRRMTILGWGFDLEILAIARRLGYHVATIPAPDWQDPKGRQAGLSGDSAARASVQVLRDLLRVRIGLWRGSYRQPHSVSGISTAYTDKSSSQS